MQISLTKLSLVHGTMTRARGGIMHTCIMSMLLPYFTCVHEVLHIFVCGRSSEYPQNIRYQNCSICGYITEAVPIPKSERLLLSHLRGLIQAPTCCYDFARQQLSRCVCSVRR